jgi:hypothetical protein
MLAAIARFERVAAWSRLPGMRFHLRQSPVRILRERLWMAARPESRVEVRASLAMHVRLRNAAPRFSTLVLNRSTISTPAPAAHLLAPAGTALVTQPGVTPDIRRKDEGRGTTRVSASHTSIDIHTLEKRLSSRTFSETSLVTRLARRGERAVDLPAAPARHVQRPAPAATATVRADNFDAPSSKTFERGPVSAGWPGAAPTPAPVNVEQITDQVLRQLDRRLIASRERLGKI